MINNTIKFHPSAAGAFTGYKLSSYILTLI